MMDGRTDQWWAEPNLDQHCLGIGTSCPLFKPKLSMITSPECTGASLASPAPFPLWSHSINLFDLLICFFSWHYWDRQSLLPCQDCQGPGLDLQNSVARASQSTDLNLEASSLSAGPWWALLTKARGNYTRGSPIENQGIKWIWGCLGYLNH